MNGERRWAWKVAGAVVVAAILAGSSPGASPATAKGDPVTTVRKQVNDAIASAKPGARSVIVTVDGRGIVVNLDGTRAMPPASTQKLFTAGAALLRLPPQWRARTEVRATFPVFDTLLPGDLVLVGGGDATLTGADLDRLAHDVAATGVLTIEGNLYVDDSRYDRSRSSPGWKPNWVTDESGPMSALAVDHNRWRRDTEFVADPATANGNRFRGMLDALGVRIAGETMLGRPQQDPTELLAIHESAPLPAIVHDLLKVSDNFASEMLLKEVGTVDGPRQGTTAGGVEEMWRQVDAASTPRGEAADGSGLSSLDRETAAGEVRWLQALDSLSVGAVLRDSLPIGCVDGTLKTRFCKSPGSGKVRAKTGTLNNITALTGYTVTAAGHRVWFSILLSGLSDVAKGRAAIDKAVNAVTASSL